MINNIGKKVNQNEVEKGFECSDDLIPVKLALIHSEVSEALECDRKSKFCTRTPTSMANMLKEDDETFKQMFESLVKDTFSDELADILLSVAGLAAWKGIDLETHCLAKMRYNSLRPHKHGGKKY